VSALKPISIGLVGYGVGAEFHAKGASLLKDEGILELKAVAARNEERVRSFAKSFGIESWYTDYKDLLRRKDLDAIIIATPHHLHASMTLEALDAGKHVLVEKPMAISLKEADDMIASARRAHLRLGVALEFRFDDTSQRLKKAIDEEKLGRLIFGDAIVKWFRGQEYYERSPWRGRWVTEGGGALINQAIHTIDLLRWYMGAPELLWGRIETVAHRIEVEDLAAAVLRFRNGALGVIEAGTSFYPGFPTRLEIHGLDGTVVIEGDRLAVWSVKGEGSREERREFVGAEGMAAWARPEAVPPLNHARLLKDFALSIIEDREPYISGEEGRKSLEVVLAIYKSSKTGEPVLFPLKE
jgi:predicted dehydrogenase